MKSLPIVQCHQCRRFIEFDQKDLVVRRWNQRYEVNCKCKTYATIPLVLVQELGWNEEPKVEAPPKPAKPPEENTSETPPHEKVTRACQTYVVVQKCGSKAAAARKLGVSVTTVNNYLKHLPSEYSEESAESVSAT